MSRLSRFVTGGWRSLAIAVPVALGACTTLVESGSYRTHYPYYGTGFSPPVVVVPAPRSYYYGDRYRHRDRYRDHHHHERRGRW